MRTPPRSPSAAGVLAAVRRHWLPGAESAVHLPVGFGAHHWRIDAEGGPALFATLDEPSPTRSAASFEAAYRAARALEDAGQAGVLAPQEAADGRIITELGNGLLSVTSWHSGRAPTEQEARGEAHVARTLELLRALHGAPPPGTLQRWAPRVGGDLAQRVEAETAGPWTTGPLGEEARGLLRAGLARIAQAERRYRELRACEESRAAHRAPTHGEPHWANQMLTDAGTLILVDWETLAAAPRERDLAALPEAAQRAEGADPEMLELFALEWSLSEVEEYMRWFRAPHTGTDDDRIALDGLREELQR